MAEREPKTSGTVEAEPRARRRLQAPRRRKVLLHNDDYTTQEFVIEVLQTVFHHPASEAVRLTMQVHHQGLCVAGVYPAEIAEAKAARVCELARQQEYPFLATTEEE
ncbi:MAG: ATP-dependent Clp protease adaptor ClpS [Myxococcales bacterium]